ncbi:MAG: hypothetical protein CBE47_00090 [Pelagibacteraceae bacterium TMED287]|nr:MAG: hypothetical protein CBE47_00090 [Pelagibacteraceae bacterium TMED287]|tara:strand:- start:1923 stop:2351 length:429 start_codon:yes stop_codon:yes gene_type:complete
MNPVLLIIIGVPTLEILTLIKVGQNIGAINTVLLIFLTAIVGIYYARIEGLNTIKSGFLNIYKNRPPVFEMISGASIAIAAMLLIFPGFITDVLGFILLFPITRKLLINFWIKKNFKKKEEKDNDILDGEIVDKKNDKNNEL